MTTVANVATDDGAAQPPAAGIPCRKWPHEYAAEQQADARALLAEVEAHLRARMPLAHPELTLWRKVAGFLSIAQGGNDAAPE
jgi:hypothetical protein